jgi:glucosylceramidase
MKIIETCFNENIFLKEQTPSDLGITNTFSSIAIGDVVSDDPFVGFGGAITEAAGYAYAKLNKKDQEKFIKDYLSYNIMRISIGSCDFSLNSYAYAKKKDLSDFSIDRDKQYIIPLIKDIQKANPDVQFLATPWSPPSFMKNFHQLYWGAKLKAKYYKLYAEYIAKFILAYQSEGISISYMTVQNETTARQVWESCLFSPEQEAEFAINYLYPTLKENNLDIKILIHDHNKDNVFERASKIFDIDKEGIISGIGIHWYTGDYFENVKKCRDTFKDKLIFHTEGCVGFSHYKTEDEIKNANMYAHDIIGDLNSGVTAYIDWNILLDNNGGPNHKNNFCNAPSMLKDDGYYNNLCYFYIQHFSRYINPQAKLMNIENNSEIEAVAFKNINNSISIVLLNTHENDVKFNLNIDDKSFYISAKKNSIMTIVI